MQIEVAAVPPAELVSAQPAEGSAEVRARVLRARQRAEQRAGRLGAAVRRNAELDGRTLEAAIQADPAARRLLAEATARLKLSARSYHRVLRVARTLADLDASERVRHEHVAEALSYRGTPATRS